MPLDPALAAAIGAAVLAGFVRGFAGFGAGLIFMPLASAAIDPRHAAAVLSMTDTLLTLPMVYFAVRACRWPTVLPAALAAIACAPLGAYVLASADPMALRWAICLFVFALLALLVSPLRYSGEPHTAASLGVGAMAGMLSGIGQIPGPPVIAFWVNGPYEIPVIRANIIVFFALVSLSSMLAYAWNGLYTAEALRVTAWVAPCYGIAVLAGSRFFGHASPAAYRRTAYAVIALAAVSGLPLLDGMLR